MILREVFFLKFFDWNGLKIENAAIAVEDGKFSLVADASVIRINPTAYDTIIKLNGKHIYPSR